MNTSEDSLFITDLKSESMEEAIKSASKGKSDISATFEKTVGEEKTSKLVICATSSFMADVFVEGISDSYPLSYVGSNKDFVVNAMSYLGGKNYTLSIRKDFAIGRICCKWPGNKI